MIEKKLRLLHASDRVFLNRSDPSELSRVPGHEEPPCNNLGRCCFQKYPCQNRFVQYDTEVCLEVEKEGGYRDDDLVVRGRQPGTFHEGIAPLADPG